MALNLDTVTVTSDRVASMFQMRVSTSCNTYTPYGIILASDLYIVMAGILTHSGGTDTNPTYVGGNNAGDGAISVAIMYNSNASNASSKRMGTDYTNWGYARHASSWLRLYTASTQSGRTLHLHSNSILSNPIPYNTECYVRIANEDWNAKTTATAAQGDWMNLVPVHSGTTPMNWPYNGARYELTPFYFRKKMRDLRQVRIYVNGWKYATAGIYTPSGWRGCEVYTRTSDGWKCFEEKYNTYNETKVNLNKD